MDDPEFVVEWYAGHRAEERPLRFGSKGGAMVEVTEVIAARTESCARMFRVRGEDGATWILRRETGDDAWTATRE